MAASGVLRAVIDRCYPTMRKSPQEKKRLSLLKDRRNTYGEHSKGSRKSIARHKRERSRVARRLRNQPLRQAIGPVDAEIENQVEGQRVAAPKSYWKKVPDTPLGEVIQRKMARRIKLGIVDTVKGDAAKKRVHRRAGK